MKGIKPLSDIASTICMVIVLKYIILFFIFWYKDLFVDTHEDFTSNMCDAIFGMLFFLCLAAACQYISQKIKYAPLSFFILSFIIFIAGCSLVEDAHAQNRYPTTYPPTKIRNESIGITVVNTKVSNEVNCTRKCCQHITLYASVDHYNNASLSTVRDGDGNAPLNSKQLEPDSVVGNAELKQGIYYPKYSTINVILNLIRMKFV